MSQFLYTMFITNNDALFHLWWKENLAKYQKVSKFYIHECLLRKFLLLFIFFLTAPVIKSSHTLTGIYFVFLKKCSGRIWTSVKRSVKTLSSKTNLALLCNLVALILNWSYVKSPIVTKIVHKIEFKVDWRKLEVENYFQRQSWRKHMRQSFAFMWNSPIWGNFNLYFSAVFC